MAPAQLRLKKGPNLGDELKATTIIEGLLYLLSAYTGNHDLCDKWCLKCEKIGMALHADNRCECVCHRARQYLREHAG